MALGSAELSRHGLARSASAARQRNRQFLGRCQDVPAQRGQPGRVTSSTSKVPNVFPYASPHTSEARSCALPRTMPINRSAILAVLARW
ncbi:hypothetical protein [Streptomyces noursei]|uniref:hypothetical protein n=1 Tax=Streptomyces noursei TaxID=1971 RepID=UPI001300368E|nr:hypothetical protein [Streptomyces noursei]MCZ0970995.1 hypothetical protein [Streptomyces noursei]